MMRIEKSINDCKTEIENILTAGLQKGLISSNEAEKAKTLTSWDSLQPILDKAQGVTIPTAGENAKTLSSARAENPLLRTDFTEAELEKLRVLAPREYEMLRN